uniref:Uncharacterized protein n=1 Tax=Cacopsylla melanoneura TaxID=428564 RepID=A0A8D8W0F3_9HEMI
MKEDSRINKVLNGRRNEDILRRSMKANATCNASILLHLSVYYGNHALLLPCSVASTDFWNTSYTYLSPMVFFLALLHSQVSVILLIPTYLPWYSSLHCCIHRFL